jgi:hypothetical protein
VQAPFTRCWIAFIGLKYAEQAYTASASFLEPPDLNEPFSIRPIGERRRRQLIVAKADRRRANRGWVFDRWVRSLLRLPAPEMGKYVARDPRRGSILRVVSTKIHAPVAPGRSKDSAAEPLRLILGRLGRNPNILWEAAPKSSEPPSLSAATATARWPLRPVPRRACR